MQCRPVSMSWCGISGNRNRYLPTLQKHFQYFAHVTIFPVMPSKPGFNVCVCTVSREELTRYWRSLPLTGNNVVVDLIVTEMVTGRYHTAFFLRPNTLPCNCSLLLDYYLPRKILDNILFHRAFERLPPLFHPGSV